MKITCTKENLSKILQLIGGAVGKQSNLPILEHVLLIATESKLECVTTNLEMAIKATIRAKVDEPGTFTVPAKTLTDYVNLLRGEQVTLVVDGNELIIESGSSKTRLKGSTSEDFPVFPEIEDGQMYSILAEPLCNSLKKVSVAAAHNDIRPELSGIYWGFFTERHPGLVLAATDSYRLAEKKMSVSSGADERKVIVPARTVSELVRLLTVPKDAESESVVRICVSQGQVLFRYASFELTSRLVEGKYPDYTQIIPQNFRTTALLPVDSVVNEVRAASIFSTAGVNAVSFDVQVEKGVVNIASESMQRGAHTASIDGEITGENTTILLNHKYVLDGLSHVDSSDVEININGSDMPCLLRSKGSSDYLYIVMPIRK